MKKYRLLFKVFAGTVAAVYLLSGAALAEGYPGAPEAAPDAYLSGSTEDEAQVYSSYSWSYLESDAPDEIVFQKEAGGTVRLNYTINNAIGADEYRIACSGENVTLLSPAEYSAADETGGYALEFLAPEYGNGKISLTLTFYSDGVVLDREANSYLYCSSCDLGVFLSEYSEPIPELAMAKARFDANEITSLDYYNLALAQHFKIDYDLMNMLAAVASDNIEYSGYAAPYVEAIHNKLFGIESDAEVPDISDTLNRMREDLGFDPDTEASEESPQITPDSETAPEGQSPAPDPEAATESQSPAPDTEAVSEGQSPAPDPEAATESQSPAPETEAAAEGQSPAPDPEALVSGGSDLMQSSDTDTPITIYGSVKWRDASNSSFLPAKFINIEIIDCDNGEHVIATAKTNEKGDYSVSLTDGATKRQGGYDIIVRVLAQASYSKVYVTNGLFGAIYQYDSKKYENVASEIAAGKDPFVNPVNFRAYQEATSADCAKAIQIEQAAALASEFAQRINKSYFSELDIIYPGVIEDNSFCFGKMNLATGDYNKWDTIMHEYGHHVEASLNTFIPLPFEHYFEKSAWDEGTFSFFGSKLEKYFSRALAWGEGWATWFALYGQQYMIKIDKYITAINTGSGVLGDLNYNGWFDIESPTTATLGETNEGAVAAVLWDLTDEVIIDKKTGKITGEQFDTLPSKNFDFKTLWGYAAEDNCKTLNEFIIVLTLKFSESDYLALGNILSEYHVSPGLSKPADGSAAQIASKSPDFEWTAGGSNYHKNNDFMLVIYKEEPGGAITQVYPKEPPSGPQPLLKFSLSDTEWKDIVDTYGGSVLHWAVYGIQNETDGTGPYLSNSFSFICPLQKPEVLCAVPEDYDSILFLWLKTTGATNYRVYRSDSENGTYTLLPDLDAPYSDDPNAISYIDTGLTIGKPYYYKVEATASVNGTTIYSEKSDFKWAVPIPNFTYIVNPDGTYTITGYTGSKLSITIPSAVNGIAVTGIGDNAFSNSGLTSIVIPSSITNIGAGAFSNTTGLTSITIPDSVISIGEGAFSGSSITSINLPDSLTEISANMFNSSKLASILIPGSINSIGAGAFSYTSGLTSITIPNSVTYVGDYAFRGSGITSIKLSNTLTAIGEGVFSSSALTSIVLPKSITSIGDYAFINCYDLSSVTYSNNITYIGDYAFMSCGKLKDLLIGNKQAIPKSISYIGLNAFADCTSLQSINVNPSSSGCNIGDWAFSGCTGLTSAVIKNVDSVGGYVFWNCGKLTQAEFKNVGSIGTFAFLGCESLEEVSISNAGTVGSFAFSNCGSLKTVSISGTGLIDMQAFAGCGNMATATVGAKEIGSWAFANCGSLKDLKLEDTEKIGDGAFIDCPSISKVNIPKGTKTIGIMAFLNCSSIGTVSLPNTLTSIGINAFSACSKLKSIVIPGSVTSLGVFAFAECTSMTKAVIPGSVTEVSPGAFANCSSLKTVQLGEGIQSILEHAFAGCSALANINRPGTLTFIDETAFEGAGTSLSLPAPTE